jgi:hypothetical protein
LNKLPVARALIVAGANVNATDREGASPFMLASMRGNNDLVTLMRRHGGTDTASGNDAIPPQRKSNSRYTIGTTRVGRCDWFELGDICERVALRDADEIERVSESEMRLIFYSGKSLTDEGRFFGKKTERERYVAIVRDRRVVESYRNVQVIDWKSSGCGNVSGHGDFCWNQSGRTCEKWGTYETGNCESDMTTP